MTLQANSNFDFSATQEPSFDPSEIDARLGQLGEERLAANLARDYLITFVSEMPRNAKVELCARINEEISNLTKRRTRNNAEALETDVAIRALTNLYKDIRPSSARLLPEPQMCNTQDVVSILENLRCQACSSVIDVTAAVKKLLEISPVALQRISPIKEGKVDWEPSKRDTSLNIMSLNSSIQEPDGIHKPNELLGQNGRQGPRIENFGNDKLILKSLFSRSINQPEAMCSKESISQIIPLSIHTRLNRDRDEERKKEIANGPGVNTIFDQNKIKSHKKSSNKAKKRSESETSRHSSAERSSVRYYLRKQSADAAVCEPETNRNLLSGFDSIENISGANLNCSRWQNSNHFDSLSEINLKKMFSKKNQKLLPKGLSIPEESASNEKYTSVKKAAGFVEADSDCSYRLTPYDPFGLTADDRKQKSAKANDSKGKQDSKKVGTDESYKRNGAALQTIADRIDTSGNAEEQLLGSFEQSFGDLLFNNQSVSDLREASDRFGCVFPKIAQNIKNDCKLRTKIDGILEAKRPDDRLIATPHDDHKRAAYEKKQPANLELPLRLQLLKAENQLKEAFVSPRCSNLDPANQASNKSSGNGRDRPLPQEIVAPANSGTKPLGGVNDMSFKNFENYEKSPVDGYGRASNSQYGTPMFNKLLSDSAEAKVCLVSPKVTEIVKSNVRTPKTIEFESKAHPKKDFPYQAFENGRYQRTASSNMYQTQGNGVSDKQLNLQKKASFHGTNGVNQIRFFEMKRGSKDDMSISERTSDRNMNWNGNRGRSKNCAEVTINEFNVSSVGFKNHGSKGSLLNAQKQQIKAGIAGKKNAGIELDKNPSGYSTSFQQLLSEQTTTNTPHGPPAWHSDNHFAQNQNTNPNRELLASNTPTQYQTMPSNEQSEGIRRFNSNPRIESNKNLDSDFPKGKKMEVGKKTVETPIPPQKIQKFQPTVPLKADKLKGVFRK